ncbi:hypothetical protein [Lentzea sp. NPDC059081]|uniref:hypothetical protein n=1 Tax=Lentzea sp. NPDC059081 TaxID=3346719 RepID=UPI0036B66514
MAVVLTATAVLAITASAEAKPLRAESAPISAAAETACGGYTNVSVGSGWYLHVPSVTNNSGNYNCVVVRGHYGFPVLVLQESLNACYGQGLAADKDFGGNTERGVRNAQTTINQYYGNVVSVDGRFGPQTSYWFWFQAYDHNNGGSHTGICYRR